jgi:hypothetical protein
VHEIENDAIEAHLRADLVPHTTAVPELLHPEVWMPSSVLLKKTPPFTELHGAREFWNCYKGASITNYFWSPQLG